MSIHLLVIFCSHNVHLIQQELSLIVIRRLFKDLKEQATEIINYEKKEMITLTYEETKSYEKQKACYICKKGSITRY